MIRIHGRPLALLAGGILLGGASVPAMATAQVPLPEPSTWALLAGGVAAAVIAARIRGGRSRRPPEDRGEGDDD